MNPAGKVGCNMLQQIELARVSATLESGSAFFGRLVSAMTRPAISVMASPGRRFESPAVGARLLTPIQFAKRCGYGVALMGADRSFPARGYWFWPCVGSRRPDFRRCF